MLISCRLSITGLHILLLSHVAYTFVLLTANVEDVKKIARKFVSDSLAEKITDFIVKATDTMSNVQNAKASGETDANGAVGPHQVSAENKMYNAGKLGSDSLAEDASRPKEDNDNGKDTFKDLEPFVEKKRAKFGDLNTTPKSRTGLPKPVQGRSRYIANEKKDTLAADNAYPKQNEKDIRNKESVSYLKGNIASTPKGKEKKKDKDKGRRYKLLSGFDSVEFNAAKGGIPDSKAMNDDVHLLNLKRSEGDEIVSRKADIKFDPQDNEIKQERAKVEPLYQPYGNEIFTKTDKIGSLTLLTEKTGEKDKWWEKGLTSYNQDHDEDSNKKSWF